MISPDPHPDKPEFEYNYITDGISIGTNLCCQAHFDEDLLKKGIEVDVSLEAERVDAPYGVYFYLWLPVVDHTAPRMDQLEGGVSFLQRMVKMRKKVYVHCKHGHGRAPTLVAAYLVVSKNMEVDQALAFIKKHRPTIHLEKTQKKVLHGFKQKHATA